MIDPRRPSHRHLLYTAGPISPCNGRGYEDHCAAAQKIAVALRLAGWSVVCPHMNSVTIPGFSLDDYLREDFEILGRVDAVVLLPHWQESRGALREVAFATDRGLPCFLWSALLPDWRA